MSKGVIIHTIVDPRMVFAKALEVHATSVVLCHNHPSGNLRPSRAYGNLPQNLKVPGNLWTFNAADHLIVSDEGYYSFADEGMI